MLRKIISKPLLAYGPATTPYTVYTEPERWTGPFVPPTAPSTSAPAPGTAPEEWTGPESSAPDDTSSENSNSYDGDISIDPEGLIQVYDKARKLRLQMEQNKNLTNLDCLNNLRTADGRTLSFPQLTSSASALKKIFGIGGKSNVESAEEIIKKIIEAMAEFDEGVSILWEKYKNDSDEDDNFGDFDLPDDVTGTEPERWTGPWVPPTAPSTSAPALGTEPERWTGPPAPPTAPSTLAPAPRTEPERWTGPWVPPTAPSTSAPAPGTAPEEWTGPSVPPTAPSTEAPTRSTVTSYTSTEPAIARAARFDNSFLWN